MENFKKFIETIHELSVEEWVAFSNILTIKQFCKHDFFLQEGEICKYSGFVSIGLFRLYSIDSSGKEKIVQFNAENTFLTDCESYTNNKPSHYNIEALENSELVVFKNKDLENLCSVFPNFEKIGRRVTQDILAYYKEHINLILTHTPHERYNYLLLNKAELIQRVSVTHLAQFLGLTRETVSRLRGKTKSR